MSVEENHTGTNEQIKPFLRFPVWQKPRTGATVITSKVDLPRLQNRTFQFHSANHSDKPLKAKIVSAMASTIFKSSLHCTISKSKEMIFPRQPPYFTGKVLPCCIIDGTKCHCTGGMEPCVQWHFLNKHYLLNLCFMYSLAFNSRVSSSGASGSI